MKKNLFFFCITVLLAMPLAGFSQVSDSALAEWKKRNPPPTKTVEKQTVQKSEETQTQNSSVQKYTSQQTTTTTTTTVKAPTNSHLSTAPEVAVGGSKYSNPYQTGGGTWAWFAFRPKWGDVSFGPAGFIGKFSSNYDNKKGYQFTSSYKTFAVGPSMNYTRLGTKNSISFTAHVLYSFSSSNGEGTGYYTRDQSTHSALLGACFEVINHERMILPENRFTASFNYPFQTILKSKRKDDELGSDHTVNEKNSKFEYWGTMAKFVEGKSEFRIPVIIDYRHESENVLDKYSLATGLEYGLDGGMLVQVLYRKIFHPADTSDNAIIDMTEIKFGLLHGIKKLFGLQ